MKKNYYLSSALLLCILIYSVAGFGQQLNPFMVKQKTSTQKTQKAIQPLPLNFQYNFSSVKANNLPLSLNYSTMAFIQPGAVNTELFTSLRHDENGLLIFAESKVGTELYFNSRSDESRIEACYNYLGELKKAMRISNPANEFKELAVWSDDLDIVHYKMQQYYEGIKVFGGQVILHGTEGMINKINGTYYPTPTLTDLIPTIDNQQAIANAINDLRGVTFYKEMDDTENAFLDYQGPESELIIYHDSRDLTSEQLAYRIVIRPNVIEHWVVYVDAKNGSIIEKYNMTCTDGPATAQAQDLNGVTQTIHTYQVGGQYYFIDASRPMFNTGQSELPDNPVGAIWTLDANNTSENNIEVYQIVSSNNNWNNPTAVSAHNSAAITYGYFKNTHGRNSIDGQGGTIISIINITDDDGSGKDNAFWNGKAMFYGNGDQLFYPLAGALDVGAHEMAHGVTQHTANLIYKDQSGAINEAMSDIAGCMVDRDDWRLAEDVVLPNSQYFPSGAMRDMSNPHNGATDDLPGWQPQHTNEMYNGDQDNGGVHTNSGIINYAYYMIAEAISKNKAEDLYYRALANYMTQSSQFIDCRLAFEQAAKDIHGDGSAEFNAVVTAFFNVGIGEESGGGDGSGPPGELPQNPGDDYILFADDNPGDPNSVYISNTTGSSFIEVTETPVKRKLSITDDGSIAVFIAENSTMRAIDLLSDAFDEWELQGEAIWDNVAVSKNGSHIAAITTEIDSSIWIYSFEKSQWAKYKLYNPTFSEGVVTYNVLYADAIEFDYSGEYLIYDAYNELKNDNGDNINYWDMGIIRIWNNAANDWGDSDIFKLYPSLPEGVNIGNPSLSKNSPYILAFDYFDNNSGDTYILGSNLETGEMGEIFKNDILGFPNYSKNDKIVVFDALNEGSEVIKQIDLKNDKITSSGTVSLLIDVAKWPVWFTQGTRDLTDVEEIAPSSFIVNAYPNPFSEELSVSFEIENNADYTIEVFDIYGHLVYQQTGHAKKGMMKSKISTSNFVRGTYFIRIAAGNKLTTKKIVKI